MLHPRAHGATAAEPVYEPADYLAPHTRRQGHPDPGLWHALTRHTTDPHDLYQLGSYASVHAMIRQAAVLLRAATLAGHPNSGTYLIRILNDKRIDPNGHAVASWVTEHTDIADPSSVADLVEELRKAGARELLAAVLATRAVEHANVTNVFGIAPSVEELRAADMGEQLAVHTTRAAEHTDTTGPAPGFDGVVAEGRKGRAAPAG